MFKIPAGVRMPQPLPLPGLARRRPVLEFFKSSTGLLAMQLLFFFGVVSILVLTFFALSRPLSPETLATKAMTPCVRQHATEHVASGRSIRSTDLFRIERLCARETEPTGPWREQLEALKAKTD